MPVAAAPACLGLRYEALAVRVESDEPSHLAWLREFLTPAFDSIPASETSLAVRLVSDAVRYADALQRGPDPRGREVPCFWLDTGVVRLPRWAMAGPRAVVFDRESRAFYTLCPGEVDVLAPGGGQAVRSGLMRIVRDSAMAQTRRHGALVLHAAAALVGEQAVLIAGPKGAGKTTLLTHLVRGGRAGFVANDRVVIPAGPATPTVRALPTIVKVRYDSVRWFPDLRRRLEGSGFHHRLTVAEASRRPAGSGATVPNGVFSLSPAQFCTLAETRAAAGGRFSAIVFPRLTHAPGALAVRRLSPPEATAALVGAQLGSLRAQPPGHPAPDWMPGSAPLDSAGPTDGTDEDRCRTLARDVPVFECSVGRDTYDDPGSAGRLFDAVGA
jgi:hypothetical protein